jgi:DNA-binding transcriptional regulator GbsR (MarR family)
MSIFKEIMRVIYANQKPISVKEICDLTGFSRTQVHSFIQTAEKCDAVKRVGFDKTKPKKGDRPIVVYTYNRAKYKQKYFQSIAESDNSGAEDYE